MPEQRLSSVRVEDVTVNEGGRAIIPWGRGLFKIEEAIGEVRHRQRPALGERTKTIGRGGRRAGRRTSGNYPRRCGGGDDGPGPGPGPGPAKPRVKLDENSQEKVAKRGTGSRETDPIGWLQRGV